MVAGFQSGLTFLAADRISAAACFTTSTFKKRVRGSDNYNSGRLVRHRRSRRMNSHGSRQHAYKITSGRCAWPSRDPIEEDGGLNLYGFSENDSVAFVDSLGEQKHPGKPRGPKPPQPPKPNPLTLILSSVAPPKATSDCGGAESTVKYRLENAAGKNGWLIQHVNGDFKVTDSNGKPVPGHYGTFEYWEAWHVIDGVIYYDPLTPGPVTVQQEGGEDIFGIPDQGNGTKGTLRKEGHAEFYEGYTLTKPPWGAVPSAGGLPSMTTSPFTWSDSGKLFHNLSTEYDCTCSPIKKTTVKGFPF